MTPKVDYFLDLCKISAFLSQFDCIPQSVKQLFPVFWHFTPESEHKLRETDEIGPLLIKNVENHVYFCVGDVDSLIFYNLFELFVI